MVRGPGKYKTRRGGGRSFSRNMALDREASSFPDGKDPRGDDDDDSDEEEEEEEEEEQDKEEDKPELTRAQRKASKKESQAKSAAKEQEDEDEEDEDLINPNHVQKKLTISDLNEPRQLSRREREQKEKKEAEEHYWRLHVAGKTEKAKSDLERLAKVRTQREIAARKRAAETEEKAKEAEAKKVAQLSRRGGKV